MKDKIDFAIKIGGIILIALISLLIILDKPTITLKGDKNLLINYDSQYEEPGFIATFMLKDVTDKVKIENNIDSTKIGTYKVKYTLKLEDIKVHMTRVVKVVDKESPVIELVGDGYACPGKKYQEEGYKAFDNLDGDITKKVKKISNNKKIIYSVKDKYSNKTTISRNIIYKDIKKPTITLNGEETININIGDEFNDPGVFVTDNCDSNIDIKKTGSIDTNKEGSYIITYSAIDSSGNKQSIKRIVNVIQPDQFGKGRYIYLTFDDGPSSSITPELLKILKEENIKATFFVINHEDSLNYLIKQEFDDGHTVGLHSYTHVYSYVYSSADNYFNDLSSIRDKVHSIIGEYPNIIRFPGGSSNTISRKYQAKIMSYLTQEVINRGYIYFDWNVSGEDAGSARNSSDVYNNIINNLDSTHNVVLLHDFDSNYKMLDIIRDIIIYGKQHGFTFKAIDKNTKPIRHGVNN